MPLDDAMDGSPGIGKVESVINTPSSHDGYFSLNRIMRCTCHGDVTWGDRFGPALVVMHHSPHADKLSPIAVRPNLKC